MKRCILAVLLAVGFSSAAWAQEPVEPPVVGLGPLPADGGVDGGPEFADETSGSLPVAPRRFSRFWGSAEYLLWSMKDAPLPAPLIVGGPPVPNLAPVLTMPMQVIAMGADDVSINARSGARFTVGYWGDDDDWGTTVSYFFLGTASTGQTIGSTAQPGSAGLTIPFIDATTGAQSSTRVALPGGFAGAAALDVTNDLQGWEWNGLARVGEGEALRFHVIGGFRYLNFVERLTFTTSSPSIVPPPDVFTTQDAFDCRNYFYGGQIGGQVEYRRNRLLLRAQSKLALGAMQEVVVTGGSLFTTDFGAPTLFPAGYFAGPTNNGKQSATRFAVIPEVNLNIGYQVTRRAALLMGWSFLYVSNVVRPGNQIDRAINTSQFPSITGVPSVALVGVARPGPQFNTSDFWAQGINFALQLNY